MDLGRRAKGRTVNAEISQPKIVRQGNLKIYLTDNVDPDEVIEAMHAPGDLLHESPKSHTKRVGKWVVKSSLSKNGVGLLKHTFNRSRYRRAWRAGFHLLALGVPVPTPRAFIERGRFGVIAGNVIVSDYIEGCVTARAHLERLAEKNAQPEEVLEFLERLAESVNRFSSTGVYQNDFKCDNVLTRNGTEFFFIDWDDMLLDHPYDSESIIRNHVQISYDVWKLWDEDMVRPFIAHMLPEGRSLDEWMTRVRVGLEERFRNEEAVWGRTPS